MRQILLQAKRQTDNNGSCIAKEQSERGSKRCTDNCNFCANSANANKKKRRTLSKSELLKKKIGKNSANG